jgi:phenylpropionate dioxygenase-like ring-hydroxylating dioxygenase large terminal subunit
MKVCRYDDGNTVEFLCPYHGWSYATDGTLVGVPFAKDAYGEQLDKSRWGLIEVAQMESYKGTIWATWDRSAPPFLDYLGGYKLYLDLLLDAWDGREGGTEVIGGVHKWLIPCNWKFPAENFSGDRYHGVSHRSVDMVGIGPSGQGRRDNRERNESRWLDEGKDTLTRRVKQIRTGVHWAEQPPSRICHMVSNVQIQGATPAGPSPAEVAVKSRFLIYRNRVETETDLLVGKREDLLRWVDGGWRIARRKIILDQSVLLTKNLTFFF